MPLQDRTESLTVSAKQDWNIRFAVEGINEQSAQVSSRLNNLSEFLGVDTCGDEKGEDRKSVQLNR